MPKRTPKKHKRPKVQKAWLERRLYKLEKRIDKFNKEALMIRATIKIIDDRAAKKRKEIVEATNVALHDAGIKSAAQTGQIMKPGGITNASSQKK